MRRRTRWTAAGAGLAVVALVAFVVLQRMGAATWSAPVTRVTQDALPPVRGTALETGQPQDPWRAPSTAARPAVRYKRFESYGRADGLPSDRVTTVLRAGATLYVGTDEGLAVGRVGQWRIYSEADGLAHRYVTSLAHDAASGDVWISTLRGLSRLSGSSLRTWTQLNSGLMNDVVYHVVVDGPLVWAATAAGTSCLDSRTGTWALYDHGNTIMHEPWCYALAVGPERTWVGVWGGGIAELDRRTQRWREYRDPDGEMEIDLLRDDGPIHDVTSFVAYDAGVLWQATYFGLARYDGRHWKSYLAHDTGLPGDFINHVAARGHTAWLATDQGFGTFDGTTCVRYRRQPDGTCEMNVVRDGREVESVRLDSAPASNYVLWTHVDDSGVWLATAGGLSHGVDK